MAFFLLFSICYADSYRNCLLVWAAANKLDFRNSLLDTKRMATWVEAHPPEHRPLAQWISEHIKLHDHEKAIEDLTANFNTFQQSLPKDAKIVFYAPSEFSTGHIKSNFWLTGAIMEKFPQMRKHQVVRKAADLDKLVDAKTYVVMVDDASYSGVQLSDLAERAMKRVGDRDRVHVFTGFQTDSAVSRVEVNATFHKGGQIHTIKELLAKEPEEKRQSLEALFYKGRLVIGDIEDQTLDLFTHKTPDYVSFPEYIVNGFVVDEYSMRGLSPLASELDRQVAKKRRINFIREAQPPYKQLKIKKRE